jgi:hypothetical protein
MPTFRDVQSSTLTGGTSLVVTKPAAVVDGDFMIVTLLFPDTRSVSAVPSGWTLAPNSAVASAAIESEVATYTKTASSEGSSWTWTLDSSTDALAVAIAYSGQHAITPLNVSLATATGTSSTSQFTPSITPSVDGCKIVAIYALDTSVTKFPATDDASPDATERIEAFFSTPSQNIYVQDYDQTTAAAISLDATFSGGASPWINCALAISPSTAPAVFSVLATGDDGYVECEGATATPWPPFSGGGGTRAAVTNTSSNFGFTVRKLRGGFQANSVGLMRFDTSALPDGATITAATLRVQCTAKGSDGRNIAIGYYDNSNWPIDTADYTEADSPTADAATVAIASFTAAAQLDIALSNLTSISKSGYTGFRWVVDGGDPGATDYRIHLAEFDHATTQEPLLIVTYTTGLTPPYVSVSIA